MHNRQNFKTIFIYFLTFFALAGCHQQTSELSAGMKHDSGYIQVARGKLFYERFGSGSPIVVLHGGPGLDHHYLLPQMLELANDHDVIFYDQRGSGLSFETPINTRYINLDQYSRDLEALRIQLRLKKFTLIAHSWGGLLGMTYAVTYPKHLSLLILLQSAPANYRGQLAFIQALSEKSKTLPVGTMDIFSYEKVKALNPSTIDNLYRTFFSIYFYDPQDAQKLNFAFTKASAGNTVKIIKTMSKTSWLKPRYNLFPKLKKLNVPTLIVHGNQDILSAWTAQEMKDSIPNSQILYIDHCGHFSYIEKPDELFPKIREFLSQVK